HWRNEKDVIDQIKECTKKIDELRNEAEQAERVGNYQRVAEINYGLIPELQKKIEKAQTKLAVLQKDRQMLKEEITEEDIAKVVARWTGIPVAKMLSEEN